MREERVTRPDAILAGVPMTARADYGIDAPGVVKNLLAAGGLAVVVGLVLPQVEIGAATVKLRPPLLSMGVAWLGSGLLMLSYSRLGKPRHRDRILDLVEWKGDEQVLDVGTGRGLLMIGAARRAPRGRAVGIDTWSGVDLSDNRAENTLRNSEAEGVRDRVEVRSEDARNMSFPGRSFDLVLSNLCLHNIPDAPGRAAACAEIARVLRPGGTALLSDFRHTRDYAAALAAAGLRVERLGPYWLTTFPPLAVVRARKPPASG
jgi:arsenite methyltransferase